MAIQVINGVGLDTREGFDKVTSTDKITAGYHNGTALLSHGGGGQHLVTQSISDTRENYYFNIAEHTDSSSLWSVTYGHVMGTGSNTDSGNIMGETEAIYRQWAQTLLAPNEVTGGFFISRNKSTDSVPTSAQVNSGKDEDIYVLIAKRELMKDRLNKKNWTLQFSGSNAVTMSSGAGGVNYPHALHLTDDSNTTTPTATPAGPRYNIVSGSQGTVAQAASVRTYGFYYPDQGVMVFSATELSQSIASDTSSRQSVVVYGSGSQTGFASVTSSADQNYKTALRMVNTLQQIQFRNEEDQTSVSYFCRARAGQMNFTNNPTFVSGSQNELRNITMKGNPTVFITGVELYDANGDMVATGKLSTPLKKNFASEATIKTKITF